MHLDELKKVYLQHNITELIIGYEEKGKETVNQDYTLKNKEENYCIMDTSF